MNSQISTVRTFIHRPRIIMTTHRLPHLSAPRTDAVAPPVTGVPLVAADGRVLAARWSEPADGPARAVAVIHPGAGIPARHYRAFAAWLAGRGYAVLSYDYRGIGDSRHGSSLRDEPATMGDWARLDMSAALTAAERRRATHGLPLLLVGHSFGGHAIGFASGVERADAILAVASQGGEWRVWPRPQRYVVAGFFGAWVPALVGLFGCLPGWALGGGAPAMPAGVARDWSRWGLRRGYFFTDPEMQAHSSFRAIVAPVHLWSIADDWAFAPRTAVDALAARFAQAAVQRHRLHPGEVGARAVGHFGIFRRDNGPAIWSRLLAPIEAAAPALRAARLAPL